MLHGRRASFGRTAFAMALGMLAIFTLGTIGLARMPGISWQAAFEAGFLDLQLWDALKIGTTALLASGALAAARR